MKWSQKLIAQNRVLAIIPARGGSKGLPGKNIRHICGKPLIGWSIEQALASKYIDEVAVSTDSEDIAAIAKEYGAQVPFLRPAHLSTDTASTIDTMVHCLSWYQSSANLKFDVIVLLEPTSPLREDRDVDVMLETLCQQSDEFDAIISVGEVKEHPGIVKQIRGKRLMPFVPELPQNKRRQDNVKCYFPFGVAYIVKTSALLSERTIYPNRSTYFMIKRYQCYEIDDVYDALVVEQIMKFEWGM